MSLKVGARCQRCVHAAWGRGRQNGSMLVIAVVVIVIIGLLTVTMSRLLGSSSEAVSYEVLGARALAAAHSGLDRGLYQLLRQGSDCNALIATSTLEAYGLPHCRLSYSCTLLSLSAGNSTLLSATGACDNGQLTVQRKVEALVR